MRHESLAAAEQFHAKVFQRQTQRWNQPETEGLFGGRTLPHIDRIAQRRQEISHVSLMNGGRYDRGMLPQPQLHRCPSTIKQHIGRGPTRRDAKCFELRKVA